MNILMVVKMLHCSRNYTYNIRTLQEHSSYQRLNLHSSNASFAIIETGSLPIRHHTNGHTKYTQSAPRKR